MDPEGRRELAPWVLLYTTSNQDVPFTRDVAEVVEVTDTFLSDYFFDLFGRVNFATLDDFRVMYVNSEFNRDGPNEIEYSAVAYFDKSSPTIPQESDLDVLLRQAFVGASLANYTRLVQELPAGNPFANTTRVEYTNSSISARNSAEETGTQQLSSGEKGAIAAASTLIAIVGILIGGLVYHKKRTVNDERKSLVHGHFSFGDTVVTTTDDRTLESLPQDQNLHSLRNRTDSGGYVDNEFESLADSSTYTSRTKPPQIEPMLYDDELPDDLPAEYALNSSSKHQDVIPTEEPVSESSPLAAAIPSGSVASVSGSSSSENSTDSEHSNEAPSRPVKPPPSARNLKASL